MPPKKKSRISTAASPAPPPSTKDTPAADTSHEDDEAAAQAEFDASVVADPWTDEEEIGLFKGLIKWKPTGVHKHFHILSLQQYLLSNGYIHPGAPHTRIPQIWAKLRTLYDLDALDERENANAMPWSPTPDDEEADELGGEENEDDGEGDEDFDLPEEEFGDLKWRQRFPDNSDEGSDREESPATAEELVARADSPPVRFTPSFEIAESEEKPTPSRRARGAAAAAAAATSSATKTRTKTSRASAVSAATRRSSRVADSVDPEEEEEDEEEAEESGEESGAGSTASDTPAPKSRNRAAAAAAAAATTRSKPAKGRAKRKR